MISKNEMDTIFNICQYAFTKHLDDHVPPELVQIVNKIITLVAEEDHVTFVRIEKLFEREGFRYKCTDTAFTALSIHAIVWRNWNQAAYDALKYAMKFGGLCWWPCTEMSGKNPVAYLMEGKTLKLKVTSPKDLKLISDGALEFDRWLPIVFITKETWYDEFMQKEVEDEKCRKH